MVKQSTWYCGHKCMVVWLWYPSWSYHIGTVCLLSFYDKKMFCPSVIQKGKIHCSYHFIEIISYWKYLQSSKHSQSSMLASGEEQTCHLDWLEAKLIFLFEAVFLHLSWAVDPYNSDESYEPVTRWGYAWIEGHQNSSRFVELNSLLSICVVLSSMRSCLARSSLLE